MPNINIHWLCEKVVDELDRDNKIIAQRVEFFVAQCKENTCFAREGRPARGRMTLVVSQADMLHFFKVGRVYIDNFEPHLEGGELHKISMVSSSPAPADSQNTNQSNTPLT